MAEQKARESYYERLVPMLSAEPKTVEELMAELALPRHKETYVLKALSKAIASGECVKIATPGEKRKFKGHKFRKT